MAQPRSDSLSGLSVLVVEDDRDCRRLVEQLLVERSAHVNAFSSGLEALEFLENHRADLLVSDIAMPDFDGYDLLEAVRTLEESRGHVWMPALALTAFNDATHFERAARAGYQRSLAKPFEVRELIRAVMEISGRAIPLQAP